MLGFSQGCIQAFPSKESSAESIYGSCESIARKTPDDTSIVNDFPDPNEKVVELWLGDEFDDDYVISHAGSMGGTNIVEEDLSFDVSSGAFLVPVGESETRKEKRTGGAFPLFMVMRFSCGIWKVLLAQRQTTSEGF